MIVQWLQVYFQLRWVVSTNKRLCLLCNNNCLYVWLFNNDAEFNMELNIILSWIVSMISIRFSFKTTYSAIAQTTK